MNLPYIKRKKSNSYRDEVIYSVINKKSAARREIKITFKGHFEACFTKCATFGTHNMLT